MLTIHYGNGCYATFVESAGAVTEGAAATAVETGDAALGAGFTFVSFVPSPFSGQKRIARIAITSTMITMAGQWALVKDQMDDACAVA